MLSRRQFLALTGAGGAGVALAGCGGAISRPALVMPTDPIIGATEARRRAAEARVRDLALVAAPATIDLGGGIAVDTWAYNGSLPGAEVRITAGEVIRARFRNGLPEPTTIHWHGIALRNDMDGVPGVTQQAVAPGASFDYEFTAPDPGTYWFHPHTGMHTDTGLYAPLVVEDPREPGAYDREYTIVLDDWVDGFSGGSPTDELGKLQRGEGGHAAHAASGAKTTGGPFLGGAHPGDVTYPLYLLNGRRSTAPATFDARPNQRIRFRVVNAAADTPFRLAFGGHRMTVTHADGFPVEPVKVDNLVVAMAERYDVVVTVGSEGTYPIVAVAEAKGNQALGVLRVGSGGPSSATTPAPDVRPAELDGRLLQLDELRAARGVRLPEGRPDRTYGLELGEGEGNYRWTINGRIHGQDEPLTVEEGQKIRLAFTNNSVMFHPMHLHGHTFQVVTPSGAPGARKDTAIVRPGHTVAVDFVADNPGQWMLHCHNIYHQQSGMMTSVAYLGEPRRSRADERAASAWRLVCDYLGKPAGIS